MSSNEKDVNSILRIQSAVRGHVARKKYGVKNLKQEEMASYKPFLIGNDMPLSQKDFQPYQIHSPFVLVGTSMFRSIDFACKIAPKGIIPKVIIVDNSKEVFHCWIQLKRFFNETKLTNEDDFLEGDNGLLEFIINEMPPMHGGADIYMYFTKFFKLYSFEHVKRVVTATAVVRQDWCDEDTFTKIKNIYCDMPIVVYPSNIISYVQEVPSQAQILKCMGILEPTLCIYANLDKSARVPTKTYIIEGFSPETIAKTLNLPKEVLEKLAESSNKMEY